MQARALGVLGLRLKVQGFVFYVKLGLGLGVRVLGLGFGFRYFFFFFFNVHGGMVGWREGW